MYMCIYIYIYTCIYIYIYIYICTHYFFLTNSCSCFCLYIQHLVYLLLRRLRGPLRARGRLGVVAQILLRGQKMAHQNSTPQKSLRISRDVFQCIFGGIFQWIVTFVIAGV